MRPPVSLADNISSGTTVVLPAPGGACNTARPPRLNASIRGRIASWMGSVVMGPGYRAKGRGFP